MEQEQLFVSDVMDDVVSFEKFMKNFSGLKYEKSFATNDTVEKPLRTNGLISTYDLFNKLTQFGEPVNDIPEFLEEYGNMEILEDKYDNTYNYCGFLDEYVNFSVFNLENDQTLVTLAVGLGLDPRGGYTKKIAFVFETEYDFLEAFSESFNLLEVDFTDLYGKKFYASFSAETLSEFGYLDITDQETGETEYYDETIMDATDIDDIKDKLEEILETEKVKIDRINYFWESNC